MENVLRRIRYTIAGIFILFFTVFGLIFCLFRPFHRDNTHFLSRILAKILNPIFGYKVVIIDGHNIDKASKPCVYISNHQSNLDVFILGNIMPKGVVSLGKKDILLIPLFGQMYWLAGNILIDRFNRSKAMKAMRKVATEMRESGKSIWIMPEGTRSKDGNILPFKKGAFTTAITAEVPIVPIVVSDVRKSLDFSKWNTGTVYIKALPPVQTGNLTYDEIPNLIESIRNDVIATYEELNSYY